MQKAKQILIIEDEPALTKALKEKLISHGYTVASADNGDEGLSAMHSIRPDLILLDIIMPHKGGWEVLDEMSADPKLSGTPVIVISNVTSPSRGYDIQHSGKNVEFVAKTEIKIEELAKMIDQKLS